MSTASRVRVPASTANLGPGFDALSMALAVYLDVRVDKVDTDVASGGGRFDGPRITGSGVDSEKMPTGGDNLIVRVLDRVAERRGRSLPPAILRATNQIPLARGMGSSSTAIIAGISCYEMLSGEDLTVDEVFEYAFEFEPHPDNLAAALYGGLTVSALRADGKAVVSTVDVPDGIRPVLVIPEFELSTEKARSVLPDTYSRADVVFNVQRSALVVGALAGGKWDLLAEAMKDRMHQPYRAPLIPGLEQALSVRTPGLIATALSGAGPTVLALAAPGYEDAVGAELVRVFESHGVAASVCVSEIDTTGRVFG
jgi:homoserine kinase